MKISCNKIWNAVNPYVVIIGICLLGAYAAIVEPRFFMGDNFQNILRQFGALSLAAVGMTFVIISGLFDLSIVGIFSLVSVVTLGLVNKIGVIPALLAGMMLGILCGVMVSLFLLLAGARNDAEATFITYGMGTVYSAGALMYCQGQTIRLSGGVPSLINFIGWGSYLHIPVSFFIFLIVMLSAHFFLMKTKTGTEIRMMGGNREAARLAGLMNDRNTIIVFAILGFTATLGAIVNFSRTTTAAAGCGAGYELNCILAVVIGGTRIKGGHGSVLRTTIGVLLVTILENALNMIGLSTYMKEVVKGLVLVLAIWLDYRRQ